MTETSAITPVHLKRFLIQLTSDESSPRIRFRVMGAMWEPTFLNIVHVTDTALIVQDKKSNELRLVSIRDIMEFELEEPFQGYEPHYHYKVVLTSP